MRNKEGKYVGLIPLRNFGVLDKHYPLYRSAQPLTGAEYRWLHEVLGIKLIYSLTEEDTDGKLTVGLGIGVARFPIPDGHAPTLEMAHEFMEMIKTPPHVPALIHCKHGHGRTSTFSVLAKVALGWDVRAAIKEEEEKFHYNFHHELQKDFLLNNFGESYHPTPPNYKKVKGEKIQGYA